jgi:hypothetical protein
MATGRRPFTEEFAPDLAESILHQQPSRPRELNPAVSRDLEVIILKCLEKEPQNRYARVHQLLEDASAIHQRLIEQGGDQRFKMSRRAAMGALAGFAGAAGVAGSVWYFWPKAAKPVMRLNLDISPAQEFARFT